MVYVSYIEYLVSVFLFTVIKYSYAPPWPRKLDLEKLIKDHYKEDHPFPGRPYFCGLVLDGSDPPKVCEGWYKSPEVLRSHFSRFHKTARTEFTKCELMIKHKPLNPPNEKTPFYCGEIKEGSNPPEICKGWYVSWKQLREHWTKYHRKYINRPPKPRKQISYKKPPKPKPPPAHLQYQKMNPANNKMMYHCDEDVNNFKPVKTCDRYFTSYAGLLRHWRVYHEDYPVKRKKNNKDDFCTTQYKPAKKKSDYIDPKAPNSDKPYRCDRFTADYNTDADPTEICGAYFATYDILRNHRLHKHKRIQVVRPDAIRSKPAGYNIHYPRPVVDPLATNPDRPYGPCGVSTKGDSPPRTCQLYFRTASAMKTHRIQCHGSLSFMSGQFGSGSKRTPGLPTSGNLWSCGRKERGSNPPVMCESQFRSLAARDEHWYRHHTIRAGVPILRGRYDLVRAHWTHYIASGQQPVHVRMALPLPDVDQQWQHLIEIQRQQRRDVQIGYERNRPYFLSIIVLYEANAAEDPGVERMIQTNNNNPTFNLYTFVDTSVKPYPCSYHFRAGIRDHSGVFHLNRDPNYVAYYKLYRFSNEDTYTNIRSALTMQHFYSMVATHKTFIADDESRMQWKMLNKAEVVSKMTVVPVLSNDAFSQAYQIARRNEPLLPILPYVSEDAQTDDVWNLYDPELHLEGDDEIWDGQDGFDDDEDPIVDENEDEDAQQHHDDNPNADEEDDEDDEMHDAEPTYDEYDEDDDDL